MSELLRIINIGEYGLATDPAPWVLPPEFITSGLNFKVVSGSIVLTGGSELWSTAGINFSPAFPFHVGSTSGDFWLVAGRSAVYVFDGVTWTAVSSAAGYTTLGTDDELRWTGCMLGQIPIINNPQVHPEYWAPQQATQILQPLDFDSSNTWAAKGYSADVIRSHKNFLFALNLHEGGTDFPDSYRWSHPADINGLPATWDETDDAFLAGKAALGGEGGQIIDGYSLRDAFCMYSESAIDILDYTSDEFVWRRRNLSNTTGLLSRNSAIEIKGTHFFLADGDIVKNDGNSIISVAHDRIRKDLSRRIDINNYDRSYAVRNDGSKEIWFCIPESGLDYPNIAYIYNWRDNSWAIRDIPTDVAFSNYGSQTPTPETWDGATGQTWDSQRRTWNSPRATPLDDTIVGADPVTGSLHLLEVTGTSDDDFAAFIERTDFPLVEERQVTTITRIYPHMSGDGPVDIQFGSQDFPGAPVRWKPAVSFNPSTDRKVDIRTTGELHCWRYSATGKISFDLSGFTIEYVKDGLR